ncbi:hypothetical protein BDQ12DRAFT_681243 [Crucibulum laeve]|uniref:Uncharacterized protein n=1 Tax=Crucibulum laeve TaxID=68775 RepID=A0A5C3M3K4_9AGAR|nr:hypothetical protein BDQ12DRAFT_681243 [Crucibulum laeve]
MMHTMTQVKYRPSSCLCRNHNMRGDRYLITFGCRGGLSRNSATATTIAVTSGKTPPNSFPSTSHCAVRRMDPARRFGMYFNKIVCLRKLLHRPPWREQHRKVATEPCTRDIFPPCGRGRNHEPGITGPTEWMTANDGAFVFPERQNAVDSFPHKENTFTRVKNTHPFQVPRGLNG